MFLNEVEKKLYSSLHEYLNQSMILSWDESLIIKAILLVYSESDNGKGFGEKGYIEYQEFVFTNITILRKPEGENLGNYLKYDYYDDDEHYVGTLNEQELNSIIENNQALAISYCNHPTTIKLEDGNVIFNSEL